MGTGYMCHFSALHCIRRKNSTSVLVVHIHVMMRLLYHAYTALLAGMWYPGFIVDTKDMMSCFKVRVCVYMVMSAGMMHLQLLF